MREGGVLEQVTHEVSVEALPTAVPESISHDVSEMVIGDTVTLDAVVLAGVTLLGEAHEIVVATLTPPRLRTEDEEIELETALVGEGEEDASAESDEAEGAADGDGGSESNE